MVRRFSVVAALLLLAATGTAGAADITVSAAASLTNAFKDIAQAYQQANVGDRVQLNFGGSDALVQQIAKGAPVDVLASADQEAMDKAESQRLLQLASRVNFASNRVVLIVPASGGPEVHGLGDLLHSGVKRITLGNPASVPIGRYAKHALEQARLWTDVEPKAIYATSVRQSLDYVARGEADAGFVYATDVAVQKDKVKVVANVATDTPVSYPIAVTAGSTAPEAGRRFVTFVLSPVGQAILGKYGFGRP
ncbi:molybdate ABC transporter substrate-binding protein [Rugamonas apoptosis]|uniref:Molybdate ABC transporter substrate-binding protein n=1 Tax=Rugamonas apoptosis TaxID=2758570 RepID=A0A7W2F7Z3_9BURK|nr:molybdate ABC transporter substrate-binding protein [Rugamonas apoptosis]MBA5686797.1 molybdate ABC transporter substrate-binding protein [Rugamonas apoptosis]